MTNKTEAAISGEMGALLPCPPHEWAYAPTVGYFRCGKCGKRVDHSEPEFADLLAEYEALLASTRPTPTDAGVEEALHEAIMAMAPAAEQISYNRKVDRKEVLSAISRALSPTIPVTPVEGLVAGCHVGNLIDNLLETAEGCDHSNEAALASLMTCAANVIIALRQPTIAADEGLLNDIAEMMGEFVDNWPKPKRVSTALKLVAKTMRAALDPPKHQFWGAGEPDCPREIKAGNGELHTLRCKVCGQDDPRDDRCSDAHLKGADHG